MELAIGDVAAYRKKNPKVCEIPFNSTNKYHVSLLCFCEIIGTENKSIYLKYLKVYEFLLLINKKVCEIDFNSNNKYNLSFCFFFFFENSSL